MIKHILTKRVPAPRAPYSQATVASGQFIFISGQGPFTPEGELVSDGFEAAARQTFENVIATIEDSGRSASSIVRVGVYLRDMADFPEMNRIYEEYIPAPLPARTTIQSDLPRFPIEVDAVALVVE